MYSVELLYKLKLKSFKTGKFLAITLLLYFSVYYSKDALKQSALYEVL